MTDYSALLLFQLRATGIKGLVPEYRFHETRKWRIDFADPARMLAVEIDGAVHRIKARFKADIEKHQALFFGGWRLLRVSTHQVRSGEALQLIERALG